MTAMIIHLSRDYLSQEYVEQFMEMAVAFDVGELVLVAAFNPGVKNIRKSRLNYRCAFNLNQAMRGLRGTPVFVTPDGEPLRSFKHPTSPIYIFGDDAHGLPLTPPPGVKTAGIEVHTPGNIWSQQAAAIVLHDRLIKSL